MAQQSSSAFRSTNSFPLARYDANSPNVVSARLRKAAPKVTKTSKLSKLLPMLKGLGKGSIPTAVAFTVLPMLLDRLVRGSDETQMRNQMDIQKKLEMEQMGQMAGGPSMGPGMQMGMPQQRQPSMTDLMASQDMIDRASRLGQQDNMLQASLDRPSGRNELEDLLAGDEVRLRQLQSPRRISPYEIMGILNGS